jgi:effector-binding domain-containing protein
LPTLAPGRTDPSGADEVTLVAKPAAVVRGELPWDDNLAKLNGVFARIKAALDKAGVKPAGRPVVIFLDSDDVKFKYEALVPLPEGIDLQKLALGDGVVLGRTPEGKAIRFAHKGSYDEIDGTYEVVTAYLDAKGIEVKDPIIEEYLVEGVGSDDASMELHIYVQPK